MKWAPYPYQKRAVRFLKQNLKAAGWVDMGLGKTSIALTAALDLMNALVLGRGLIVAPLRVCKYTWPDEIQKWDHLRGMKLKLLLGSPSERKAALREPADLYAVNYENLLWLLDHLDGKPPPWDFIIWDEASKMKNPSSKRFRQARQWVPLMKASWALSGTPAPQGHIDMWAPYYLLDGGERLGKFITHFRDQHFQPDHNGFTLKLLPGHGELIECRVADITLVMSAQDHLDMPPLLVNTVRVDLPPALRPMYEEFEREMFLALEDDALEAVTKAALTTKCRQFTAGAVYIQEDPEKPAKVRQLHDAKLAALDDIIEQTPGAPLLVAYEYKHTMSALRARYPRATFGVTDGVTEAWNAGRIPLLFAHPASVGHGLNLQAGGRHLVFLTVPWSLELYQQMVCRLYRQGQQGSVVVHHIVCPGTIDEAVDLAIARKATTQAGILKALGEYRQNKSTSTLG